MHTPSDPRFSSIRDAILPLEGDPFHLPEDAEERAHAAVALILRSSRHLELLLIKRAVAQGDPWSGQMALPGGRRDPSDPSLLHTAMRETEEETAVSLDGVSFPMGRLEPMVPATHRLPPILIFPFVFGVPADTKAVVASREVDEVIWTPLSTFQQPTALGTVDITYGDGSSRTFPCFRVEGRVVWGLTYRILTRFFRASGIWPGDSEAWPDEP
jgi:8-oxo-dGTP pyrophosphatase MutT (NUDIX family)